MTQAVTLTAAMRANLLSLQTTGTQLDTAQLDLSTGNKVNSALDNPVNFFAAQSLNQRASSLSALLDGMGNAVQTIQAANQGITSITSLVNQLTSITNSATQDLAKVTTQQVLQTAGADGLSSAAVNNLTTSAVNAGSSFTLTAGSEPVASFTITSGETLTQLAAAINANTGFSASVTYGNGTSMSAGDNTTMNVGSAYLSITSNNGAAIAAADIGTGNALEGLGLNWTSSVSDDVTTYTQGSASSGGTGASEAVTTGGDSADSDNYQAVLTQITALAADANYQGNKLIDGTGNPLVVNVNELTTNSITIASVDSTVTGLGLTQTSLANAGDITAATNQIQAALTTLQTQASGFANSLSLIQTRQDFTTNLVNTLQDGASQLTIADKNEEGADLLALQTQQQLGIEALSLSSQANQSVLRLFG